MACCQCFKNRLTLTATVAFLSSEERGLHEREFCAECLIEHKVYCVKHSKVHLLVCDPEDDDEEQSSVVSACLSCCYEKMLSITPEQKQEYTDLLNEANSPEFVEGMSTLADVLLAGTLQDEDRLTFGLLLAAEMFSTSLEAGVTELVISGANAGVRN